MTLRPYTKIKELEQELANLRQANERMKKERNKYRECFEAAQRCLNTARTDWESVAEIAENALEASDLQEELGLDRSKAIMNMSNMELAS